MSLPRILFVLPVAGASGGANSVVQESLGLSRIGVEVSIAVNARNVPAFSANYPELQRFGIGVRSVAAPEDLAGAFAEADIVVATTNQSVFQVDEARRLARNGAGREGPKFAYYVQDYEPLFYPHHSDDWKKARASYTLMPDAVLFAKTDWVCQIVYANHGVRVFKVSPSIDHEIFYPDLRSPQTLLSVAAMLRPKTPRRAPKRTVRVMNKLAAHFGSEVELQVFGTNPADLAAADLELSPSVVNRGLVRRYEVPDMLRVANLFLDLSDFQAFGRTGLESMACGCVPVVPVLGGTAEYAVHGRNAFVVDTRSDDAIFEAVDSFVRMPWPSRSEMRQYALETAAEFTITKAALSELRLFRGMVGG